jgi:hypothetical protein
MRLKVARSAWRTHSRVPRRDFLGAFCYRGQHECGNATRERTIRELRNQRAAAQSHSK